jgi:hypothetical protein
MDVNERESGGYYADLYQKQLLGEEPEAIQAQPRSDRRGPLAAFIPMRMVD